MRITSFLLSISIVLLGSGFFNETVADKPRASIGRSAGKLAVKLYQTFQKPGTGRIKPGVLARVKGNLYQKFSILGDRTVTFSKRLKNENTDPTFKGTHPMFKRLVTQGWYSKALEIDGLQHQANTLRKTRQIDPSTPLKEVEFLALDLEMTSSNRYGRYRPTNKRFFSGSNELTQFGYTVYRGGKAVESGSMYIRPDGHIDPKVQKFNKITPERLAHEPRLEQVAGRLLSLMKGRVLIGQGIQRRDWVWLKSNVARLGVDLPGPRRLMLDTHLMSFNTSSKGMGLKGLSLKYGTSLTNHHDAKFDAQAVGDLFFAMAKKEGITTLGQAMAYEEQGNRVMRTPQKK